MLRFTQLIGSTVGMQTEVCPAVKAQISASSLGCLWLQVCGKTESSDAGQVPHTVSGSKHRAALLLVGSLF